LAPRSKISMMIMRPPQHGQEREGGRLVAIVIIGICSLALGLLATEQLAGACDVVGAGSLGEQAVVSDAK
jgi:hypothetical protein